jgi:hypothetical protein
MEHKNRFIKVLSALIVFLGLFLLAGLWRLSESPLRLPVHFDKVRTFVGQYSVDFEEIYLFSPSLFSLPGILVQKGHFENETLDFKAENIFISWNLRSLFSEKTSWKINQLTLQSPYVFFKQHEAKSSQAVNLPKGMEIPAITIKNGILGNLPNGITLPKHHVNGTLYHDKGHTLVHFYVGVTPHEKEATLEGTLTVDGKHVTSTIKMSNLTPQEWSPLVPENIREWPEFFRNPIPIIELDFKGCLENLWPEGFLMLKVAVPFKEEDTLRSVPLQCGVTFKNEGDTLNLSLETHIEPFPWSALSQLWPSFLSPTVHSWCTERIQNGETHPVNLTTEIAYNKETHAVTLGNLKGTLGVSNGNVRYMDTMPLVENATAEASFTADEFIIQIPKGTTESLNVAGGKVSFVGLQSEDPQGTIDLIIEGPLREVLWVADHPPFRFASQYNFDPKSVSGDSRISLVLKFPTNTVPTIETIKTSVMAKVKNFDMRRKIAGKKIHFKKGDFDLKITQDLLSLKGKVILNRTPARVEWEEMFKPKSKFLRRYKLKLPLSVQELLSFTPKSLQDLLTTGHEFSIEGSTFLTLDYMDITSKQSTLILNIDLKNSILEIPLFQYGKPKEIPGNLFLRLLFKNEQLHTIDRLHLTAKDLDLKGSCIFNQKGDLVDMHVQNMQVNKSHMKAHLQQQKDGWKLAINGPEIVLPPIVAFYKNLPDTKNKKSQMNLEVTFDFPTVLLDHDITIADVTGGMIWKKGDLSSYQFLSGENLNLHYGPQGNGIKFSLKTSLLSPLLKGFDITQTIKAGDVEITASRPLLDPTKPLIGKVSVSNFRIKDAPILAKLLSLISIEGLLSTLTGKGILFVTGNAEFEYLDKKIAIPHLELTSSSLGITAKGYVDLKENTLVTEGYIIPANILNQLIGNIPLIGNILSGGDKAHKGLVSMSYSMKGPLNDPVVSSNPLSVLAPNFVKGLFSSLTGSGKEVPSLSKK